jgi:hypothetical protein
MTPPNGRRPVEEIHILKRRHYGMVWNSIEGMVRLVCVFAHVIPKKHNYETTCMFSLPKGDGK